MNTRKKTATNPRNEQERSPRCALLFYFNWLDHMAHLPEEEQATVVMALIRYARSRQQPQQLSSAGWVAFRFATHIVDHDRERYHLYDPEASSPTKQESLTQSAAQNSPRQEMNSTKSRDEHTDETPPKGEMQTAETKANSRDAGHKHRDDARDAQSKMQNAQGETLASAPTIISNKKQGTNNKPSSLFSPEEEKADVRSAPKVEIKPQAKGQEGCATQHPAQEDDSQHDTMPPTLEELRYYWKSEGMESSPEEFFDYYQERAWQNSRQQPVTKWRIAARKWERYYQAHVKAQRQRDAALAETQRLNMEHLRTVEAERQRARAEREAQQQQTAQRACSPQEARALYALAMQRCQGQHEAAIALLKNPTQLAQLRQLLATQSTTG